MMSSILSNDGSTITFGLSNEELQSKLLFKIKEKFDAKQRQTYEQHRNLGFKWFIEQQPSIEINLDGRIQAAVTCKGDPERKQVLGVSLQKIGKFSFTVNVELKIANTASANNSFPLMITHTNVEYATKPMVENVDKSSTRATGHEAPLPTLLTNAKENFTSALTEAVKDVGEALLSSALAQCKFSSSTTDWNTQVIYHDEGVWQWNCTPQVQPLMQARQPANQPPPPYSDSDPFPLKAS